MRRWVRATLHWARCSDLRCPGAAFEEANTYHRGTRYERHLDSRRVVHSQVVDGGRLDVEKVFAETSIYVQTLSF